MLGVRSARRGPSPGAGDRAVITPDGTTTPLRDEEWLTSLPRLGPRFPNGAARVQSTNNHTRRTMGLSERAEHRPAGQRPYSLRTQGGGFAAAAGCGSLALAVQFH